MTRTDIGREVVSLETATISNLSRADLIKRWEAIYGRRPPKGISRRLLEYSAAYAIQAKAYGELKPALRRELARPVVRGSSKPTHPTSARKPKLTYGARLVREWHGRTHIVDVIDDGFRYDGRDYKSLSQIAREITSARWSGPRFFGL